MTFHKLAGPAQVAAFLFFCSEKKLVDPSPGAGEKVGKFVLLCRFDIDFFLFAVVHLFFPKDFPTSLDGVAQSSRLFVDVFSPVLLVAASLCFWFC